MAFTTRAATPSDILPIGAINAASPDDCAAWQFPSWRASAAETTGAHARALVPLFTSAAYLFRVVEVDGLVAGYACLCKRALVDGVVKSVDIGTAYSANEVNTALGSHAPDASQPAPSLFKILARIEPRLAAIKAIRQFQDPEPCTQQPSYQLLLIAVSPAHQRKGIGRALIQWGIDRGVADGLPVFVTGETTAVSVYGKLGFQVIEGTWWGLDSDAQRVEKGSGLWESDKDGVSGAQMMFVPHGKEVEVRSKVYRSLQ